jgi:hypothetical protein
MTRPSTNRQLRTSPTTPWRWGAIDDKYMDAIFKVFEQNTGFGKGLLNNIALRDVMRRWILAPPRREAVEKHLRPQLPLEAQLPAAPSTALTTPQPFSSTPS